MNALILAAGLGTRLGEYTSDRPKALVQVVGRTMLEHQLRHLQAAGFDRFVINIHHFAPKVRAFLEEHQNFGLDIRLSDETDLLLDTGGGIRKAMRMFDNEEPVLVHNVDIFSSVDLKALYMWRVGRMRLWSWLNVPHPVTSILMMAQCCEAGVMRKPVRCAPRTVALTRPPSCPVRSRAYMWYPVRCCRCWMRFLNLSSQ